MGKWLFGAMGPEPAFAFAGTGNAAPRQEKKPLWHLAGNSSSDRYSSGGSSSRFREQRKSSAISMRAIVALVLLVVLPPVGIALMWYKGIFRLRGRVLMTVLGTIVMAVAFGFLMPDAVVTEVQPQQSRASLRGPLPTDAALNALSNMEQLLAGVENKPVVNDDLNEATGQTVADDVVQETEVPADPMQAVVYCVNVDAVYYHAESECRGQANHRSLTVGQALSEGLKPCGRCDPPTP